MTRFRPLLPVALAMSIAACGDEPAADASGASGEVIEGTISDAMLPLDTVRSQPPLAEPEAAARATASASGAAGEEREGEATEATDEAAEPAVEVPSLEAGEE